MNLRVALRNWLLKPSVAESGDDPCAVEAAGALVYGHIQRDMEREFAGGGFSDREYPPGAATQSNLVISYVGNPLIDDEVAGR